jgi:hypothetical protein
MSAKGIKQGGRKKGTLNKSTMIGKDRLERLASLMETVGGGVVPKRLLQALRATLKDKPEQYLSTYVAVLKHLAPPARAPEPGTEDKPMVIEVRHRGGDSQSPHESEVASAAAHLRGHGYTSSEEGDADGE